MTKKSNKSRGRPTEWTNEELTELALNTKYKYHGQKLTPSLLERETKVGRNTWTRRMKNFIDELNSPVLANISTDDSNDTILPSVELIFKKYGNDKVALKNELLELEVLLYDFYKQIKEFKSREEKFNKAFTEIESLKSEVRKQEQRAKHYEELYNDIVLSSVYPHLQDEKSSHLNRHNIKDKLINMDKHKDKNVNLGDLTIHFPNLSEKDTLVEQSVEIKQKSNIKKLHDEFDI